MNQYREEEAVIIISDSEDDGFENRDQVAMRGRFNRNQLIDPVIEVYDSDDEMDCYNNGIGE